MTTGDAEVAPDAPASLPAGARDMLALEAAELRGIEASLRQRFQAWGYREVMTPVLEFASVMARGRDGGLGRAYRLFDDSGRVLVLRPDLTIPVARLIAARLSDHPGPVRVFYVARAFRPPRAGRAQPAELRQAGVELVGLPGPAADAETVALLLESLAVCGIAGVEVAIGDVCLLEAVFDGVGASAEVRARMRTALSARDRVAWREQAAALGAGGAAGEVLAELPSLRGGVEVLDRVARAVPGAAEECARLRRMAELLDAHGVGDAARIDLGVMREREYYTGIVVEAYAPGLGAPIAMGGRYDDLGGHFGRPRAAVGMALALDEVHRAAALQATLTVGPREGVVIVGGMDGALDMARSMRDRGLSVAALEAGDDRAEEMARADGWRYVARPVADGVEVLDTVSGERRTAATVEEALPSTG